jgi:hypothetical protein
LRFEEMAKSSRELGIPLATNDDMLFGTLTLGHAHPVIRTGTLETSVGVLGSIAYVEDRLAPRYGTHTPLGAMAYLQLVPRVR